MKSSLPYKKGMMRLAALSLIFGSLTVLLGDIMIPLSAGFFASLFVYDKSKNKLLSLICSLVFLAADAAAVIIEGTFIPISSIFSLLISAAIAFCFLKGREKSEAAAVAVGIAALYLFFAFWLFAARECGSYSFDAVLEFYSRTFDTVKEFFKEQYIKALAETSAGQYDANLVSSLVDELFLSLKNGVVSLILIAAFVMAGIAFKIFASVSLRVTKRPVTILFWGFRVSNVVAYFFIGLFVLSLFTGSSEGTFSLAVFNLYNVFRVVFAYLGFKFANAMLVARGSSTFVRMLFIFAVVTMSSLSVAVLSVFGLIFTITDNNNRKKFTLGGSGDDSSDS